MVILQALIVIKATDPAAAIALLAIAIALPMMGTLVQGIVRSQPAVAGGLVYVASDDGKLYTVDAQNGRLAWSTDIGNALPREKREKLGTSLPQRSTTVWYTSAVGT